MKIMNKKRDAKIASLEAELALLKRAVVTLDEVVFGRYTGFSLEQKIRMIIDYLDVDYYQPREKAVLRPREVDRREGS